ncbi:MAG: hypothetical protein JXA66_05455 [Oligoflexia bacterium]|nr:hypothetical protein [Oligoflexia bacterium]
MMKKLITIFFVLSSALYAAEYDYLYRGTRPMGMGGAFTAVSDDVNALFFNPAGLNRIKPGEGEIIFANPMATVNTTGIKLVSDAVKLSKGENMLQTMTPYLGKNMHYAFGISMPYWSRHNFAVALMLPNIRNNTLLRRTVATQATEDLIIDSGLMVGYAHGFLQDRLAVGVDLKFLLRGAGSFTFDSEDLYTRRKVRFEDIGGYGFGIDGDIGAIYTFNKLWFFIPSVGVTINNIVATKFPTQFGNSAQYGIPSRFGLKRTVGLGSKFELPDLWHITKWIAAFDINHIGLPGTFFKKVHIGTELWILEFFGVRGGVNQGYFTFGTTLDVPFIRIDFVTYAEELGESTGAKGDRRLVLQFSFGI